MIIADLHVHTNYSHGADTPLAMYEGAIAKNLSILGFSEHSPRPLGFTYTHEYRESLKKHLPEYVAEVCALRDRFPEESWLKVLFGMEMDWLEGEEAFAEASAKAFNFDYLIGSVHFIGHWGFDDGRTPWQGASDEKCAEWYTAYFSAWKEMLSSKLYNIAAHPDLIKIYSKEQFATWIRKDKSLALVEDCLKTLKESGMAMEISSAGLRKACQEIYPCAAIMELAAKLEVPITFASDAHAVREIAADFDTLKAYASSFGYTEQVIFERGSRAYFSF